MKVRHGCLCGGLNMAQMNSIQCECGYNGPKSNFCPNCGKPFCAPAVNEKKATPDIVFPSPFPIAFRICPKCGSENEIDEKCSKCGAEIEHFPLFILSEYTTAIPLRSGAVTVYKFDDSRLILEGGDMRCFISASVLEPAYEIIKKYEIDKWEEYKDKFTGPMGGRRAVSYWDGSRLAGTSTDNMPNAGPAYSELLDLFNGARIQE